MSKKPLPTYLPIWESQFQKIKNIIKEEIQGARNIRSIITMIILLFAGIGFFLAGLSSYFGINLFL
jgi:hypothetical protein